MVELSLGVCLAVSIADVQRLHGENILLSAFRRNVLPCWWQLSQVGSEWHMPIQEIRVVFQLVTKASLVPAFSL